MTRLTKQIFSHSAGDVLRLFITTRLFINKMPLLIRVGPAQKKVGRFLVVTPKAMGSAPIRNQIRRRLKAIFYQDKLYTKGKDCVVFAHPGAAKFSFQELRDLLHYAIEHG